MENEIPPLNIETLFSHLFIQSLVGACDDESFFGFFKKKKATRNNTVPTQPNPTLYSPIKNVYWAWTQHGLIPGLDYVLQGGLHFIVLDLQSIFGITIEMSVFLERPNSSIFSYPSRREFCLKNSAKESIFQQATGGCETGYWLLMAGIRIYR